MVASVSGQIWLQLSRTDWSASSGEGATNASTANARMIRSHMMKTSRIETIGIRSVLNVERQLMQQLP